ncbi:MAG: AAA family ATPase [Clostridia bacterium]|nr:AAA family ATPase [Clostridia bacterium]
MEDLEYEKQKLENVESNLEDIQKGEEEILRDLPKKYGSNPILLANLMSTSAIKIANIQKIKEKPYFARIDFKEDKKSTKDKLYIGKIGVTDLDGKVVVTDWRAPVSTLYYDSNLGQVEYDAPYGKIHGELSLKRQIIIQNRKIESIFDVDSVSDDELLKPYLGASADSRLKNIVASIQGEQNEIIRKNIEKNLIVQGVAGSGKTTVALHRIAYLMYNNSEKYKANQFMVIGPNKFFINYISNVLPDLDASNAVQLTYEELASNFIGEKISYEDSTKKLNDIIDGRDTISNVKYKTTLEYKDLLDNYLKQIEYDVIPDDGLVINGICVLSKDEILAVYNQTQGESIKQRLDIVSRRIANNIKNDDDIYSRVKSQMDALELSQTDVEERRKIIKKELDMLKDLNNTGFEKQLKKLLDISNLKVIPIYLNFVESVDNIPQIIRDTTIKSLKSRVIENEDIAPIMYIKLKYFGNEDYKNIKCVVVDEAQDFGVFSYYILRNVLNQANFSIFGDLAQGIYSYRAIDKWEDIQSKIFEDSEYLNLRKSYRTSIEIMSEANKISSAINLGEAKPVIREAGPVIKTKVDEKNKNEYIKNKVQEYLNNGYKSIAIVYKNQTEMAKISKLLKENNIENEIIYKDQEKYNGGVCILTSYLSKGLEFDVVIVADTDESNYDSDNVLDMKLLYVAMTRALHKLELIYTDKICKYLN